MEKLVIEQDALLFTYCEFLCRSVDRITNERVQLTGGVGRAGLVTTNNEIETLIIGAMILRKEIEQLKTKSGSLTTDEADTTHGLSKR